MSYEVSIVADSVAPHGGRITTFQLKYPRMIHAEVLTHRLFSRNASSTRAIPTAKMLEWIQADPAMPVYWGRNQAGMQAGGALDALDEAAARTAWLEGLDNAVAVAKSLLRLGLHKQIASRVLEPWAHINVVVTATTYDNFFTLRCHKAAMPEIQALAVKMARAVRDSTPVPLEVGWWHLPYVDADDLATLCEMRESGDSDALDRWERRLLKVSTARNARVSYKTFEGRETAFAEDEALHDRLRDNGHWSPFEHAAMVLRDGTARSGNFTGFQQYRQTLPKSCHERFDFATLDQFGDQDFIV